MQCVLIDQHFVRLVKKFSTRGTYFSVEIEGEGEMFRHSSYEAVEVYFCMLTQTLNQAAA